MKRVVVIGGGISGLSLCYYLKKRISLEGLGIEIKLLEGTLRLGGNIRTEHEDGFTFELGPRGFLGEGRRTLELTEELGLWEEKVESDDIARIRYVYRDKLIKLGGASLLKLVGFNGFRALFCEYFKRDGGVVETDESVYEFMSRRFSVEVVDKFIELFIAGVYAGDVRELSARSIFPKLYNYYEGSGSILKGVLRNRGGALEGEGSEFGQRVCGVGRRRLISYKGGMIRLVKALGESLSEEIELGALVKKLEYREDGVIISYTSGVGGKGVKKLKADKVFIATPSYVASKCIRESLPELAKVLSKIEYAPLKVISLGYKRGVNKYRGFGFLSPRSEEIKALGCIWNDMVFPGFAPDGMNNMTLMYGGALYPEMVDWSEGRYIEVVRKDLELSMGIRGRYDLLKSYKYAHAIPQYTIGHGRRLEAIEEILRGYKRIMLLGNYLNGVGLNDCVGGAYELANSCNLD